MFIIYLVLNSNYTFSTLPFILPSLIKYFFLYLFFYLLFLDFIISLLQFLVDLSIIISSFFLFEFLFSSYCDYDSCYNKYSNNSNNKKWNWPSSYINWVNYLTMSIYWFSYSNSLILNIINCIEVIHEYVTYYYLFRTCWHYSTHTKETEIRV